MHGPWPHPCRQGFRQFRCQHRGALELGLGSALPSGDDSPCMPHPLAGRCCPSCDERGNRLGDMLFDEGGGLFFSAAADLAHH